MIRHSRIFTIV